MLKYALYVGSGGAMGAMFRFALFGAIENNAVVLVICNLTGTFIYAMIKELEIRKIFSDPITAGYCGGISIFATFSKLSVNALQEHNYTLFCGNLVFNFTLCILSVFAAKYITDAVKYIAEKIRERLLRP